VGDMLASGSCIARWFVGIEEREGGRESYISHGKPVSSQHRQQQDDGYSEKLDETHMALSKNSITPPMRKKPPAQTSHQPSCLAMRRSSARAHTYRQSRRQLQFLVTAVSIASPPRLVHARWSNATQGPNRKMVARARAGTGRHRRTLAV
jgi:hypothetical protein